MPLLPLFWWGISKEPVRCGSSPRTRIFNEYNRIIISTPKLAVLVEKTWLLQHPLFHNQNEWINVTLITAALMIWAQETHTQET